MGIVSSTAFWDHANHSNITLNTTMRTFEELQKKMNIEMEIGINQTRLVKKVVHYVNEDGMTYMEAMMQVCEDHGIEPEDLAGSVRGNLKERLYAEAVQRNCIKDESPINTLY